MDEFLNIDTPENVIFGYEIAGIGSRFLAAMVDTVLIILLQLIAYGLLIIIVGLLGFDDAILGFGAAIIVALGTFLAFAFLWGYYIFFEIQWNGQSPGKRMAGLRVIRRDGTPITLTESMIRNLVRLIDFLPAYYGIGVVAMFFDSQSRRLGDLAASTLVVFDRTGVTLDNLRESTQKPAGNRVVPYAVARLPVSQIDQDDIQMAESFLGRHQSLPNATALSLRILQKLYFQMSLERPNLSDQARLRHLADIVFYARYPDAQVEAAPALTAEPFARPNLFVTTPKPLPDSLPLATLNISEMQQAATFLRSGQYAADSEAQARELTEALLKRMGLKMSEYEIPDPRTVLQQVVTYGYEQGHL